MIKPHGCLWVFQGQGRHKHCQTHQGPTSCKVILLLARHPRPPNSLVKAVWSVCFQGSFDNIRTTWWTDSRTLKLFWIVYTTYPPWNKDGWNTSFLLGPGCQFQEVYHFKCKDFLQKSTNNPSCPRRAVFLILYHQGHLYSLRSDLPNTKVPHQVHQVSASTADCNTPNASSGFRGRLCGGWRFSSHGIPTRKKIINKKPTSKYLDETCSMLVE